MQRPFPSTSRSTSRSPRLPRVEACLLVLAAVWCGAAHAIDLDECKSVEDDAKRLACYDNLSGRVIPKTGLVAPTTAKEIPGTGLVVPAKPLAQGTRPSSLAERWDLDGTPDPALFMIRPYKPVYIMPAFYSTRPNHHPSSPNPDNDANIETPIDHTEGKFQLSLKTKIAQNLVGDGGSFWFGYTQSSRWQVYNHSTSRNFRESDYEPELMYTVPTNYSLLGLDGRLLGLSLTHQSNGRDVPLSRSWNRVIGQVGLENDDWAFVVRPWLRIRESAQKDDNPDILDYVGRGEVIAIRKLGNQQIAVTLRHSLKTGDRAHGSAAVDWAFPVYGYLKGHVQLFTGYGESLIDYNHRQNSIGVGVSLGEWL